MFQVQWHWWSRISITLRAAPLRTHFVFLQSSISTPRTHAIPATKTEIAYAVANIFNNFGVERCALLAHTAAYPKEDSEQYPLEDEITIMTACEQGRL